MSNGGDERAREEQWHSERMTHSRSATPGEPMGPTYPETGEPVMPSRRRWRRHAADQTVADVRAAAVIVGVLAVLGAALGPLWSAWSGPQQRAYVIAPGKLYPFEEVETMAAADGRYLVLVAGVGLLAGLAVWLFRARHRGAVLVLALAAGGLAGAALTWWTGHLTGGGSRTGEPGTTIPHLPLSLHMRGLLFVEPAVAILLYGVCVAFVARDDLGRPDPVRERLLVGRDRHPEHGGRDRDGAGSLQQGDLPPQ